MRLFKSRKVSVDLATKGVLKEYFFIFNKGIL